MTKKPNSSIFISKFKLNYIMAVINTQYSTLEEAWGTAGKFKKRASKDRERECDLYEARTKPKQKPYRNNASRDLKQPKNMMLINEDDNEEYEKYHGYSDARLFSRTNRPINGHQDYFRPKSKKRVSINPERNTYIDNDNYYTEDPMDYIQDHNSSSKKIFEEDEDEVEEEKSSDYIYEEVYDEDEDNYLTQNTKTDEESRRMKINKYVEEEIENEITPLPKRNAIKNNITDTNRQVLDLSIYTLSGIILIFMMEQFVQIGVKIKTYT